MTRIAVLQILMYFSILLLLVKPLGRYMAAVYDGKLYVYRLTRLLAPVERCFYKLTGVIPQQEMDWKLYLFSMLGFSFFGFIVLYLIQRLQFYFPLNPESYVGISPQIAFNTAISFITNTDWQAYSGESTLSYFTQMIGLVVQNFISASIGMSLLMALIRGLCRTETQFLGNFWVDTVRGILYILLPLSILLAFILLSQGVIQNFNSYLKVRPLDNFISTQSESEPRALAKVFPLHNGHISDSSGKTMTEDKNIDVEQVLPMGPVASQVAIMELGTNGGGFFNVNAAHPFANPTPLSNFLEMLAILLIPAALCYSFGILVKDTRQGWALLVCMFALLVPLTIIAVMAELKGNPVLTRLGISQVAHGSLSVGGNMEGKETRFGIVNSALWASVTTATSNGSMNAMYDSFTPIGGLVTLFLMQLGEVVFGGVGSGLYSMLMFVLITVFVGGLMVGRTPEYLGKKIETFEMKMSAIAVLIMPLIVLLFTAIAVVTKQGVSAIANPASHGLSEILYAFTSMGNNNGSAFAGLNASGYFYTICGGLVMLIGRYWTAIPVLAIAGSLVRKKKTPTTAGTLPTHTPLFIFLLLAVVLLVGGLSFIPALALGPLIEQLILGGTHA